MRWVFALGLWLPEDRAVKGRPAGIGFDIGFADPVGPYNEELTEPPSMAWDFMDCLAISFVRTRLDPQVSVRPVAWPHPAWTLFPSEPFSFFYLDRSTAETATSGQATAYLRDFWDVLSEPDVVGWTVLEGDPGFACERRLP